MIFVLQSERDEIVDLITNLDKCQELQNENEMLKQELSKHDVGGGGAARKNTTFHPYIFNPQPQWYNHP